jgi:hypothetical protein
MDGIHFGENWSLFRNQLILKNAASFTPHSNTTLDSNSNDFVKPIWFNQYRISLNKVHAA